MTEREKWEAGLWYDANFDEELRIEREKAEERYTEFNQTRPSQKEKRAELLHKLLPGMAEDVVILPHFYTDYGYNCVIGAGSYLNHGAYLMDCAKITIGQHCFIGPGCGMYTAIFSFADCGLEYRHPVMGSRSCRFCVGSWRHGVPHMSRPIRRTSAFCSAF